MLVDPHAQVLQRALADLDRTQDQIQAAERDARSRRDKAEVRREMLAAELRSIDEERRATIEALRSFAATGLLALACPEVEVPDPAAEWAPTPAVILARAIGKGLSDVDDGDRRWELDQQAVNNAYKALADGLSRHGHRASLTVRDDAILVDVMFQGRTQRVAELSAALDSEIAERERILSARHREILENQLVSEVAASLQELVTAAETQVREMNQELAARPLPPPFAMVGETSWGKYRVLDRTMTEPPTVTRKVEMRPGAHTSYHRHRKRSEICTVVSGAGEWILDGALRPIRAGDVLYIPPGANHAVRAASALEIIEVQIGGELAADDEEILCASWEAAAGGATGNDG